MWCIASGFCGEELNSLLELRKERWIKLPLATSVALRQPQTQRKNGSKNVCVSRFCNANRQEAIDEGTKKEKQNVVVLFEVMMGGRTPPESTREWVGNQSKTKAAVSTKT